MSKLLIVVDMQNDFIDGALGTPQAQEIVDSVNQKIKEYDRRAESTGFPLYPGHPRMGNQRQPVSASGFSCY